MEKDVLIEEIAEAMAFICYRQRANDPLTSESIRLVEIREFVLSSDPEEIDLDKTRKEIEELKKPYLNKPKVLLDD
jgi:hypothetical protein